MIHAPRALFAAALSVAALAAPAAAQCANLFVPTMQLPGIDGVVRAATVWDRDGAGPMPPLLVFGGSFTQAGTTAAASIVAYDPASGAWSALGTGVQHLGARGEVFALATASNGDLIAAGDFQAAGGNYSINHIARFDGTNWWPLNSGLVTGPVYALAVLPNGDLIAGGDFTYAANSGTILDHIGRWNGTTWSPLGAGVNNTVRALALLPNGDLVAGGDFILAGGVPASRIARWNGANWLNLGSGTSATVRALGVQGTTVFAGGDFAIAGGVAARGVASWDGVAWSANVNGLNNLTRIHAIAVAGATVYVAGNNAGAGSFNSVVATFGGTFWNDLDSNADTASTAYAAIVLADGRLVVGGAFDNVNHLPADNVAMRSPYWHALGTFSGGVLDVAARPNGTLVVAGLFAAPGVAANTSLAAFDGVRWTSLQAGMLGSARRLAALPGGDVAVGAWDSATNLTRIYRWNGVQLTQLGAPMVLALGALAVNAAGELFASGRASLGRIQVLKWDGANWVPSSVLIAFSGHAEAMVALPNGDVVVGGTDPGGASQIPTVAFWRWDGTAWSQVGGNLSPIGGVHSLAVLRNGSLVAGGDFATLVWSGANWTPLGAGAPVSVYDMVALDDGELLVGGQFTDAGGITAHRIARWDGASWRPVGAGTDGRVTAMTAMPNGDVVFAGDFSRAGGAPSPGLVRLITTCPAQAISVGPPCLGSSGPLQLSASSLPWLGGSFRANATGFAPSALGGRVLGFQPFALPLTNLLPVGNPGCSLLASLDDFVLLQPTAGSASFELAIPDDPVLNGVRAYCQVLQLELDAQLQPTALLGSNAYALTVGSF